MSDQKYNGFFPNYTNFFGLKFLELSKDGFEIYQDQHGYKYSMHPYVEGSSGESVKPSAEFANIPQSYPYTEEYVQKTAEGLFGGIGSISKNPHGYNYVREECGGCGDCNTSSDPVSEPSPAPSGTVVSNCNFYGVKWDAEAMEVLQSLAVSLERNAEAMIENASAANSIARIFKASHVNIESMLKLDGGIDK